MKHIARKRFGQHFLTDGSVIDAIVDAIDPRPGQRMVEIGPGLAALTQPLAERLGCLTVIELDRDLAARLRAHPQLHVVEADALKVDLASAVVAASASASASAAAPASAAKQGGSAGASTTQAGGGAAPAGVTGSAEPPLPIRVVGNLPYNISTPLLFHLLEQVQVVQDQHFMLQKEVVDRMVASPATADYGRLSVMLQWRYAMESLFDVQPESFEPPPRVKSAVVRMVPLAQPPLLDVAHLSTLVQIAFSMRRKLLRHSLGRWLEQMGFEGRFDLQRRAEEVPVDEFVALAQATQTLQI